MRLAKKRPWAALIVNMTPLIDVVFLIIIFFIIMINFSEMHMRNVNLPKADEARSGRTDRRIRIPLTIKSEGMIFLERQQIHVNNLHAIFRKSKKYASPKDITIQIRADEDVPYALIKDVMLKLAKNVFPR